MITAASIMSYFIHNKPRISRIQVDWQIYPTYAKIQIMRSERKNFRTNVPEISSEICEDQNYASLSYARFTVW